MSEFLIAGGNTSTQAREWAEKGGLEVRAPKDNQLFIDIDDPQGMADFEKNFGLVDAAIGIESHTFTYSRNKPAGATYHRQSKRKVSPIERCLLQAILGSDRRREGHSYCRIVKGIKNQLCSSKEKNND